MTKRLTGLTKRLTRFRTSRIAFMGALAGLVLTTCSPAISTISTSEIAGEGQERLRSQSVALDPDDPDALAGAGLTPPALPTEAPAPG
ncbi:MAG TPA: hypothetical protein VM287_06030, partial [Egibacteraceae bacterium]|nr:hypothetical protein [Egibacteraceae bacterium]